MDTFITRHVGEKGRIQIPKQLLLLRQEARSSTNDEFEMALLPGQLSKFPEKDFSQLDLESKIAYKALMVFLLDCTSPNKQKRLQSIAEMYIWMNNDSRRARFEPGPDGFEYSFAYWCEQLDVDEGYMRRKLKEFLTKNVKAVKIGG